MLKILNKYSSVAMAFAMLIATVQLSGCSKKENPAPPVVVPKTLKDKALFGIGAAVTVAHLQEPDFAAAFKGDFSQLTAEYEMKMKYIWTSVDGYFFDKADYLVNYGIQDTIKVHGHALVWYQSFPDWFTKAHYDSTNFENNVKKYISTVVGRYKGKIISWDVANEIFASDGSLRVDSNVYKKFKDPIAFYGRCFQYARDADPNVKLFYNDYDQIVNSAKRTSIKKLVQRFKKEGYPIDGIGEQFHQSVWVNTTTVSIGLADLASTGLLIHFSELDLKVNQTKSTTYVFTDDEQQKQAEMYKSIVQMYETLPQAQKFAITTWGVTDKYTWLTTAWASKEYPLLFNSTYIKKKAYSGFFAGLK
jgi:endo-1,4-beta-xylanase